MDLVLLYMLIGLLASDVFGKQDIFFDNKNAILHHSSFSCKNKLIGNYYADPDTNCQMFHVCVKVLGFGVQDFKFVCPLGLAFDQEAQICTDWGDVDCDYINLKYNTKFDLLKLSKKETQVFERKNDDDELLKESPSSNFYSHKNNGIHRHNFKNIHATTTVGSNNLELLREEPSSHFYSHRNDIITRYQAPTTKKPTQLNISEGKVVGDITSTVSPRQFTSSQYQAQVVHTNTPKQKNEQRVLPIRNNSNKKVYRQRVSDVTEKRNLEKLITTTKKTVESRRNYITGNVTNNHDKDKIENIKPHGFLKPYDFNNTHFSKESPRKNFITTQRPWVTRNVKSKSEPFTTSANNNVNSFIPTTFKPTQHFIKINRIDKNLNSTSSFISSNQISFKHKIRNKDVSQFKSKNLSKDYDYNYYEDISENLSPEYEFIEFKKIK